MVLGKLHLTRFDNNYHPHMTQGWGNDAKALMSRGQERISSIYSSRTNIVSQRLRDDHRKCSHRIQLKVQLRYCVATWFGKRCCKLILHSEETVAVAFYHLRVPIAAPNIQRKAWTMCWYILDQSAILVRPPLPTSSSSLLFFFFEILTPTHGILNSIQVCLAL